MRNFVVLIVCGAALIGASAIDAAAQQKKARGSGPQAPDGVQVLQDIEYARVGDTSLKLDLYLPRDVERPPLVVWVHGGAWSKGDKARTPITWLTSEGYALASINYRLTGEAVFPAQIHDCKAAVRFLRAHASSYGYDAERIGIAGGSAGGHLVALFGVTGGVRALEGDIGGNTDQSSRVQAVIDMYGPTDLYYNATAEAARVDKPDSPLFALLGGTPSRRLGAARLASPVYHITPDDPPLLILHGDQDPQVKLLHSHLLHEAYQQVGLDSTLHIIDGAGHGGKEFQDDARRAIIRTFLEKHIRSGRN